MGDASDSEGNDWFRLFRRCFRRMEAGEHVCFEILGPWVVRDELKMDEEESPPDLSFCLVVVL